MIVRDTEKLRKLLTNAYIQLKSARSPEERLAISNYLGNLYSSIICMGDDSLKFDKNHSFRGGRKGYEQFMDDLNEYSDLFLENFAQNKKFHNAYLGEILPKYEKELIRIGKLRFPEDKKLSKKEFLEIFNEFMKSIGLKDFFDKLYNGHIYSSVIGQDDGNLGFALFNPISRDTDLFVKDFKYDVNSLDTLAHEIGHGFDHNLLDDKVETYNSYFYLSIYGEVISKLFERLLFRFLIKNNISVNTAKDLYVDFAIISHDYFLMSYLLSALPDKFLNIGGYIDCDSSVLASKVKKYVLNKQDIIDFFERMGSIDLSESINYAYGDVLSLFLCDEVEKCGFDGDGFTDFLRERTKAFNPKFLEENGYSPKEYIKLYKNECGLIKK